LTPALRWGAGRPHNRRLRQWSDCSGIG